MSTTTPTQPDPTAPELDPGSQAWEAWRWAIDHGRTEEDAMSRAQHAYLMACGRTFIAPGPPERALMLFHAHGRDEASERDALVIAVVLDAAKQLAPRLKRNRITPVLD